MHLGKYEDASHRHHLFDQHLFDRVHGGLMTQTTEVYASSNLEEFEHGLSVE